MNKKILAMILACIISVLLVTGCSSGKEDRDVSNTDTTQEAAQEETPKTPEVVLPQDAAIGIAYAVEDGEFTSFFISKIRGYLVSAGVDADRIERVSGSGEELAENAKKLIDSGCSVLMVGNADEENAPGITDAAVKAEIPLVYFGSSPGEKEIERWKKNGWKVAYVGSTYDHAAEKRADLIESIALEKIDHSKNDEIGLVVLYSGEDKAGDDVNRETLRILEEREYPFFELTGDEEEDASENEEDTSEDEEETPSEEEEETDQEAYAAEVREKAREQVVEWMTEYGKQLEMIFCADDMQTLGAWEAIKDEKKKVGHDVVIMGFDANTESLGEIAAGNVRSSFFNDFLEQSKNAADAVLAFLRGADAEVCTTSEYVSVSVDNAQEILDISRGAQENDGEPDSEEEAGE